VRRSGIVTLTTDFGLRDPYVAALEAALVKAWSDLRVIHVSHEVPPGDVGSGAYLLEYATRTFPAGTVHLGVVDPGVGSDRAMYAVETDSFVVVGPGNGLLHRALRGQAVGLSVLVPAKAGLPSQTFESRDLMAPAAARIASGDSLSTIGPAVEIDTQAPAPTLVSGLASRVEVAYIDRFGTLILDLIHPGDWPPGKTALRLGQHRVSLGRTFADVDPGDLVAYRGSIGYVEVATRDGSAAEALGLQAGEAVEIGLD
jgi:S-adenosyl-L-methionine hydrolase (adenosine-forming)